MIFGWNIFSVVVGIQNSKIADYQSAAIPV